MNLDGLTMIYAADPSLVKTGLVIVGIDCRGSIDFAVWTVINPPGKADRKIEERLKFLLDSCYSYGKAFPRLDAVVMENPSDFAGGRVQTAAILGQATAAVMFGLHAEAIRREIPFRAYHVNEWVRRMRQKRGTRWSKAPERVAILREEHPILVDAPEDCVQAAGVALYHYKRNPGNPRKS